MEAFSLTLVASGETCDSWQHFRSGHFREEAPKCASLRHSTWRCSRGTVSGQFIRTMIAIFEFSNNSSRVCNSMNAISSPKRRPTTSRTVEKQNNCYPKIPWKYVSMEPNLLRRYGEMTIALINIRRVCLNVILPGNE